MDRVLGQRRGREHHLVPLRAQCCHADARHDLDVSPVEGLGHIAFQRRGLDSDMIVIAVFEERDEYLRRTFNIHGKYGDDRPRLDIK